MKQEKLKGILNVIKYSELPTDRWGHVLSYEDLVVWFRLDESLEPEELDYMKRRLAELAEIQNAIDMQKRARF